MTRRWGDETVGSDARGGRTVELCLRSDPEFGVEGRKQAAIDALEALVRSGAIDDFEVSVWPAELRPTGPLEGTEFHRSVLARVREFEHWLSQHDAPPRFTFDRRAVRSSVVDEAYDVVVLPCLCLAVYDDGELVDVSPRRADASVHTVEDCLHDLADVDGRVPFEEPVG